MGLARGSLISAPSHPTLQQGWVGEGAPGQVGTRAFPGQAPDPLGGFLGVCRRAAEVPASSREILGPELCSPGSSSPRWGAMIQDTVPSTPPGQGPPAVLCPLGLQAGAHEHTRRKSSSGGHPLCQMESLEPRLLSLPVTSPTVMGTEA